MYLLTVAAATQLWGCVPVWEPGESCEFNYVSLYSTELGSMHIGAPLPYLLSWYNNSYLASMAQQLYTSRIFIYTLCCPAGIVYLPGNFYSPDPCWASSAGTFVEVKFT